MRRDLSITSYPAVNHLLSQVLNGAVDVLKDEFVGMYLHGSLALHDFQPGRSDIDLVIVTSNVLEVSVLEELNEMHKQITFGDSLFAKRVESIYIPKHSLEHYDNRNARFPCLHVGGDFYTDGFGVLEKHVLREKGIAVQGPDQKTFIKPMHAEEIKDAALGSLRAWWLPQLKDHARLVRDDYQVYAVLTMCRALYSMQFGDIASKSKAAEYAKRTLDKKWIPLVDGALLWENGMSFHKLTETVDFMSYILTTLKVV